MCLPQGRHCVVHLVDTEHGLSQTLCDGHMCIGSDTPPGTKQAQITKLLVGFITVNPVIFWHLTKLKNVIDKMKPISRDNYNKIKKYLADGDSNRKTAQQVGVALGTVNRIARELYPEGRSSKGRHQLRLRVLQGDGLD